MLRFAILFSLLLLSPGEGLGEELTPVPEIERRLPPAGIEIPADLRGTIEARLAVFLDDAWAIDTHPLSADAEIFGKAVQWALKFDEIYQEKELPLLAEILEQGERRLRLLEEETHPWSEERGLLVRGYRSRIDGSVQPYGLEIPKGLDLSRPVPLLVWLHGRGDKTTDLHFIRRCLGKSQALGGKVPDQEDAIIVHPFGRQCVGWKHAGEVDVFEVIEQVKSQYPIDPDRIALAGFSMGGAGAWHIGAHYADQFCAVHAGAGFAETALYNGLDADDYPSMVEQKLWRLYDVPHYVRNLFNLPVLAYSGEEDKQKQAADVMAAAFAAEGRELRHLIGPGMGHKYDDESAGEIWEWLRACWKTGRNPHPLKVSLQTRTPKYGRLHWVELTSQEKTWEESRIDAVRSEDSRTLVVQTRNVAGLRLGAGECGDLGGVELKIDGQSLSVEDPGFAIDSVSLMREADGEWAWGEFPGLRKVAGLQGPIDDAFTEPFVVVGPSSPSAFPRVKRWMEFERAHFADRWSALMRGGLPLEEIDYLDFEDVKEKNLVLWGDPITNPLIGEMESGLPVRWSEGEIHFGGRRYSAADHVPAFIFPNPLNPERYVVINSGLTFRENHDRTNSLQNPKLGDWVVIGLDQIPDGETPGRIVESGFFDESWKLPAGAGR